MFSLADDDLRRAGPSVPDLDTASQHRAFAFTRPHQRKSRLIVLAGRDPESVTELVRQLSTSGTTLPPEGVFFTID